MYYITFREDWKYDEIFERPHYYFDTKEEAIAYLIEREFYEDEKNERYILEKGYGVLVAKIIELEKWVSKEIIETKPEPPKKPTLYIKEENQYTVVAKLIGYYRPFYRRLPKKVNNGVVYVVYPRKRVIPQSEWTYDKIYE